MRSAHGFTLLESIIAFLILSVFTVLSVNIVSQNSMRLAKVSRTYELIDVLDTAMSVVKKDIVSGNLKKSYKFTSNDYRWNVSVKEVFVSEEDKIKNSSAKMYEINVQVNLKDKGTGINVTNLFFNGA